MRKLIKANNSRKDSIQAYACSCSCSCACMGGNNKVTQALSRSRTSSYTATYPSYK